MERTVSNDVETVLFDGYQIRERCAQLAREIEKDYREAGEMPIVVGLLKGSVPFMAELIKFFRHPMEIDFMAVSSYSGTQSGGQIKINKDLDLPFEGKDVLIVEDIVDTGRTIAEVKKLLERRGARSVKVVALLNKADRREVPIEADYIGFEIPDAFVVGYGLDFNQYYRNLPFIGVLKPELYE